ncbi:MAG: hypothetical protein PHP64_08285 [Actinomycetota bacterium]|nr:hypothetical protein [Actinomycetota bacterium]
MNRRKMELANHSPAFAVCTVAGLALIEPEMGHLDKLGDTTVAKQYLLIMPTGEISWFFPKVRNISVRSMARAGILLLLAGLIPAIKRLRKKGVDEWSSIGWALVVAGAIILLAEHKARGEWTILGRIGVRYLAFTMIGVGSFLGSRDRRFLATLSLGGLLWDISSAIFWAWLKRNPGATIPVAWHHHFDQDDEGSGSPCWQVMLLDSFGIVFFAWLMRHDFDPFEIFDRQTA